MRRTEVAVPVALPGLEVFPAALTTVTTPDSGELTLRLHLTPRTGMRLQAGPLNIHALGDQLSVHLAGGYGLLYLQAGEALPVPVSAPPSPATAPDEVRTPLGLLRLTVGGADEHVLVTLEPSVTFDVVSVTAGNEVVNRVQAPWVFAFAALGAPWEVLAEGRARSGTLYSADVQFRAPVPDPAPPPPSGTDGFGVHYLTEQEHLLDWPAGTGTVLVICRFPSRGAWLFDGLGLPQDCLKEVQLSALQTLRMHAEVK